MKHPRTMIVIGTLIVLFLALSVVALPIASAYAATSPVHAFLLDQNLTSGHTDCLPIQQVAGIHGRQVEFAGTASENDTDQPKDARFILWGGTSPSTLTHLYPPFITANLQLTTQVSTGSYVMLCVFNGYNETDSISLFQSETY